MHQFWFDKLIFVTRLTHNPPNSYKFQGSENWRDEFMLDRRVHCTLWEDHECFKILLLGQKQLS